VFIQVAVHRGGSQCGRPCGNTAANTLFCSRSPPSSENPTGCRRPTERGRATYVGPHSSMQLQSDPSCFGNAPPLQPQSETNLVGSWKGRVAYSTLVTTGGLAAAALLPLTRNISLEGWWYCDHAHEIAQCSAFISLLRNPPLRHSHQEVTL
jgi:hypothetical protein